MRRLIPVLAATGLVVSATASAAPSSASVAVAAPEVDESLPTSAAAKMQESVLARIGSAASASALGEGDPTSCADEACVVELAERADATHVVFTAVRKIDADYELVISLRDGSSGEQTAMLHEVCEICGIAEVEETLAGMAARLARKLELGNRASSLSVTTNPDGARVLVDGELVGTTPLTLPFDQGKHDLRVELEGYIGQKRSLELTGGIAQAIDMQLQPVPVDAAAVEAQERRSKRLAVAGWTSIGLGVAAAGGGIPLIIIDENPIEGDCSGENRDADGDCKWRYDTLGAGIGLSAAAGALLITGLALAIVAKKRRPDKQASKLSIRPTAVGISGAF